MVIDFTTNAQARMQDRVITAAEVRTALEAPDQLAQSFENRWRARKRLKDRALEVLFLRDPMHCQVITAYWTEP